jgi:hypothetical protein
VPSQRTGKSQQNKDIFFLSYQLVTHAVQYPDDKLNVKLKKKMYCYVQLDKMEWYICSTNYF